MARPFLARRLARPLGRFAARMSPCQLALGQLLCVQAARLQIQISSVRTRMQRKTRSTTL
eukprot:4949023-Pyramimonas_sp.AAC.1